MAARLDVTRGPELPPGGRGRKRRVIGRALHPGRESTIYGVAWPTEEGMSGRSLAGVLMLTTVLGVLWMRASTAWFFHLF